MSKFQQHTNLRSKCNIFHSFFPLKFKSILLTKSLVTSEQWVFTFVLLKHSDFSSIRLVLIAPHSTTKRAGAVVSLHTRGGQLDELREPRFMRNFRQVPCLHSPSHTYDSNSSTWHNTAWAAPFKHPSYIVITPVLECNIWWYSVWNLAASQATMTVFAVLFSPCGQNAWIIDRPIHNWVLAQSFHFNSNLQSSFHWRHIL